MLFSFDNSEQEVQDDSVALAVDQTKPHKQNLTLTPALTDKTLHTFLDDNEVAIVAFLIRCEY